MALKSHVRRLTLALACAAAGPVAPQLACAEGDSDALALADSAVDSTALKRRWRTALEVALGGGSRARALDNARLSASFAYDAAMAPGWRAVFSSRLDTGWQRHNSGQSHAVNTLKQAYLSWQPNAATMIDAGRVNLREGVAQGFNPTDFFKGAALRSIVSMDPASLRENRLGSVVLRGQRLWADGAFSALVSPRIATERSRATFNPDFAATNGQTRYQLTLTQRLFGSFAPQWLLYGGEGIAPQVGVNLTTLLGTATTGYLEYAGGRSRALSSGPHGPKGFYSRLASGVTHTFGNNLSLTLELDYDGASADRRNWQALAQDPVRYGQYRQRASEAQALMTQQGLFAFARWQNALMPDLDLSAMLQRDLIDHSASTWLEARYHWPRMDVALQWRQKQGSALSHYGASDALTPGVQALATLFF